MARNSWICLLILSILHLVFVARTLAVDAEEINIKANGQTSEYADEKQCKLKEENLVYSQENAPDSISDMLLIITKAVNKDFAGVLKVNIDYNGDAINAVVGRHLVATHVKRKVDDGSLVQECFYIPIVINDVNECTVPVGHPWRHNCQHPALCHNTEGSYQCKCPVGMFGVDGSGSFLYGLTSGGACRGTTNTTDCCEDHDVCMDDECEKNCKGNFRCTDKACHSNNCHPHGHCIEGPGFTYSCACKEGYIGDGFHCEKYVPEEINYCKLNSCDRDCICKQDQQAETYSCEPKAGYIAVDDPNYTPYDHISKGGKRVDRNKCVDGYIPEIHINGPNPMKLKQGDFYEELGVTVIDKNKQGSKRMINIDYSDPLGGVLLNVGTYTVYYSLDTAWLPVEHVTKKRVVVVEDVDECTYQGDLDIFKNKCDNTFAECINTGGSYNCSCMAGYRGDGFSNGTGCVDVTPPILQCRGAGCASRTFKACNCIGVIDENGKDISMEDHIDEAFIQTSLRSVEDFCEPANRPCFTAYDQALGGSVDLTQNITTGPIEKVLESNYTWRVPYHVSDAAGNPAKPLYYYVQVEVVDVLDQLMTFDQMLPVQWSKWIILCAVLFLIILLWFLLSYILFTGKVIRFAIQYVLCPYSLMRRREDFEMGMDLVLVVMSFGILSPKERARKIAAKWTQLVNDSDQFED
mmetsp:Transcript_436/g.546  ORF Transcript_436/g.546 Transcript_436/m.546 type:complete len:692 (-) Transcript_436:193-2268(-)